MHEFYDRFLKKELDLAPLGVERRQENHPYFCTPRNASIIGWAGVDGIHYCFVRGFGDMVFAVSPMNGVPDFVHPLAESFRDFLRLLLACKDASALEQAWQWDKARFEEFVREIPVTSEQQALLAAIADAEGLTPMEDPWDYIKKLQTAFDYGKLRYTEDFYDPDMNPSVPHFDQTWKVYFDGGHNGRARPGKEHELAKQFAWAGTEWRIPSAYVCSKGLVFDFCMRVDAEAIRSFVEKWLQQEDGDETEMEQKNPFAFEFFPNVTLNGKLLTESHGYGTSYVPPEIAALTDGCSDERAVQVVEHYGLERDSGWMLFRKSFLWNGKKPQQLQSLSIQMIQQQEEIPGPKVDVHAAGDCVSFSLPEDEVVYTLNVQEYETEQLALDASQRKDFEYIFPLHFVTMRFTVTPELSKDAYLVRDVGKGDSLIQKPTPSENAPEATAIGIIGGADGPTAIFIGAPQRDHSQTVCSSPYYELPAQIDWRLFFRRKRFADAAFQLI